MNVKRAAALAVVLAALTATALPARQKIVLKDGREMTGTVTKTDAGYQVRTDKGLVVVFPAGQVLRVEEVATPKSDYQKRLAATDKTDPDALYRLAVWARRQKLLTEARDLLRKVLALKPDHENARLQLRLVRAEIAPTTTRPSTGNGDDDTRTPTVVRPSNLLSQEDIYRIRFIELTLRDSVSVEYRNNVLRRFIAARIGPIFEQTNGEAKFRRASRVEQVVYIRRETDRRSGEYRDDILIKSDPRVLKAFKSTVWPIVVSGCGRTSCHGGAKGQGKFRLLASGLSDDRILYTNFYILHKWKRDGKKMINRDVPENSLLLEHGLPADIAKKNYVHPKKLDDPVFRDRSHPDYRRVKDWIESLAPPADLLPPGYRVDYKVPGLPDAKPTSNVP